MVHIRNIMSFVCILLYLVFCNSANGSNSMHQRSRQQQTSSTETTNVKDKGVKRLRNTFTVNMTMPGAHLVKAEEYLCTASKRLSSRKTSYIVGYKPHAHSSTAHHILLFGCKYPASKGKLFRCSGSVCHGEEHIIYAWAKDAKALRMPEGVGFAVGGRTGINYIVMQIHYARSLKGTEKDYSGIGIQMTHSRVKHLAEIYMMGSGVSIPPRSARFHANFACRYNRPYDMIPFAYRTHSHSTGRVISGYRVRNGKWKLIGINNPQRPQAFYPIQTENRTVIHRGDIMAGRCTYDTSHRNRWTVMGATSRDEMCNLYLMYYKVYRRGRLLNHRRYPSECFDVESGISVSSLKFPVDSDKLPDSMKTTETHSHHHHHGMMGVDHGVMEEDHGRTEGHRWLMGNDIDDDQNEENEPDDDGDPGDDDLDDESNLLLDGSAHEKNSLPDETKESEAGFDFELPEGNDFDDRLIQEEPDPDESHTTRLSSKARASGRKMNGRKGAKKDSKLRSQSGRSKFHEAVDSDLNSLVSPKSDKGKSVDKSNIIETPKVDGDWPYVREKWKGIGQVSALGMDGKHMLLLHRGDRVWDGKTFDGRERLVPKYRRSRIATTAVLHFDPSTGKITKRWGKHRFYLPHGLTVDSHGNIWITDVGAHQVYKFASDKLGKPALTLGVALRPGRDDHHFCKPSDVAVESNGNFFVADGYCNNRIMKFSAEGKLIGKWGRQYRGHGSPGPFEFDIPHSLALDDGKKLLYVANRELGRIHCFTTDGKFVQMIQHTEFGGRLFAVSFTPANGGLLYAVSGKSFQKNGPSPSGFTIDPKSKKILRKWSPFRKGFTSPHDVHVLVDGSAVFVSEIGPNRVWKFNVHKDSKSHVEIHHDDVGHSSNQNKSTSMGVENDGEGGTDLPYRLKKPNEDDSNIIPALVIVVVLATPIALICAAATIQHLRFKYRRNKALVIRNRELLSSKSTTGCFGRTKTYYHDDRRGFDKLIGEDDSEESEEDYFVRKGAI